MKQAVRHKPQFEHRMFSGSREDVIAYIELQREISDQPYSATTDVAEVAEMLQQVTACFILESDKIIGFIAHQTRGEGSESYGYIWELIVINEYRERGIGSRALKWAMGCYLPRRSVVLHVQKRNAKAQRLYQRHGFYVIGEEPDPARAGELDLVMIRV